MSLSMLHSLMFKVKCGDSKGGGVDESPIFGLGEIDA